VAEVFWTEEGGVGHKLDTEAWFRLIRRPPFNFLEMALAVLAQSRVQSVAEEGPYWRVALAPWTGKDPDDPLYQIKADPERFFGEALRLLTCCPDEQENRRKFLEAVRDAQVNMRLLISREDHLVREHEIVYSWLGERHRTVTYFSPSLAPLPTPRPSVDLGQVIEVPEGMLAFTLPSLGGWMDVKTHSPWTQRALDLIEKTDTGGKYRELYEKNSVWAVEPFTETLAQSGKQVDYKKNHPLVLGAYYEDETAALPQFYHDWFKSDPNYKKSSTYYFPSSGYMRDCHHYGHQSTGLQYEWYFVFRGTPPKTTKPGDRYYSARDWGYGYGRIDENLNRLTFTEAIKQYYRYSEEGKRNAYLMLGQVAHLLEDSGHPDHAAVVCHPASGYNAEEFLLDKGFCKYLSLEMFAVTYLACLAIPGPFTNAVTCLVPAGLAQGIAYGVCKGMADSDLVGYERLAGDHWDITKVEKTIQSAGVLTQTDYDSYFKDLGDFSLATLSKYSGLSHALGCASLSLPPLTVPNSRPVIDSTDSAETKPYLGYTDAIVPRIIGTTAGFIQHFYRIVNFPPYLERMAIVQWESGDSPRKFAFFKDDAEHCVRFDAEWTQTSSGRTLKNNVTTQKLSLDRPAYVFLLFGPSKIGPLEGGRQMAKVELHLTGKYAPTGGQPYLPVTLTLAKDEDLGYYYWGSFNPKNCMPDPYMLNFEVTAQDSGPHLASRASSGADLDSDPATIAVVDSTKSPTYPFTGYQAGTDTNHQIWVAPFSWSMQVNPKSHSVTPTMKPQTVKYLLKVTQKSWDCNWEETQSPPNCAVTWSLREEVKQQGAPGTTGYPADFGFKVEMAPRTTVGEAEVKATVTWTPRYTPATYEIYVEYSVGDSPYITTGTVTLTLQIN
jgi:hypothetical protein